MKKIVILALVLSMIVAIFAGCGKTSDHFTGQWNFSKIQKVEIASDAYEGSVDNLKEQYGAADENGIVEAVLADFKTDKVFDPYYVRFEKKQTYTYDPVLDREATWVLYKTGENEGFLSFYTELDTTDITLDPAVFPPVVYNAETDTLLVTVRYGAFLVTIELTR